MAGLWLVYVGGPKGSLWGQNFVEGTPQEANPPHSELTPEMMAEKASRLPQFQCYETKVEAQSNCKAKPTPAPKSVTRKMKSKPKEKPDAKGLVASLLRGE